MLNQIITNNYNAQHKEPVGNNVGLLSDKEELLYVRKRLDGTQEYIFSVNTIITFDELVINNDQKLLSPEQKDLFMAYLMEEHTDVTQALDKYLGECLEIVCTKVPHNIGGSCVEQLYCKCK